MKYFTPDLIVAYGSDDPTIWGEAEKRWEAACEEYNRYIASVNSEFPSGLRRLDGSYFLHDAVIQCIGQRDGELVIQLQLDPPPQSLVTCTYDLVDSPTIHQDVLPPEYRGTGRQVDWQYHEIEKVDESPPTWRQSIVLSNGWEITLHFRDVHVVEARALLPAPRHNGTMSSVSALTPSA